MKHVKLIFCMIAISFAMCISAFAMSGSGTETNPYLVSTPSDIALMHNDLDRYYKLTADIDMAGISFEPIGNENEGAFTGIIDGDGYTISNLNINLPDNKYVGFVGYLEGTVKNINLIDVAANGYHYVGGLVGYAEDNSQIENCSVSGKIDGLYLITDVCIGGITGYNQGTIINCTNNGNISNLGKNGYCYGGGIAGKNNSTITNCLNYGTVSGMDLGGGIAGYNTGHIKNCINRGSITKNNITKCTSGGGITGITSNGTIKACKNYGEVLAMSAGGISCDSSNSIINECENFGNITGSDFFAAGIVGRTRGGTKIEECVNYGTILIDHSSGFYAAGITEWVQISSDVITNCMNYGSIESIYGGKASGIVGSNDGTVKNCANFGRIISSYLQSSATISSKNNNLITNCLNSGAPENIIMVNGRAGTNCIDITEIRLYSNDIIPDLDLDLKNVWYIDPNINSGFPNLRNMPHHIDLNECVLLLKVGESDNLEAFIDGVSESVTWSSEDEDIALVSADGTVTAKATGDIMITATNAEGMKANCLVHITKDVSAVSLNKSATQITAGSSETLTYQLNPVDANEVVIWSSSDETVATVDQNGNVSARAKGTATITVTTVTSNKSASCEVTVVGAPITSVSIPSSASINIGSTYKLSLSISPSQYAGTVTWSSSDETVATVDQDGVVTGLKAGNAVITVRSDTGKTATCTVTVNIPSTAIILNKASLTLEAGTTEKLVANLTPVDSTDTVSWSSSNSSYASVASDGTVTAKSAYSGTITITATTTSGLKAYCMVRVIDAKAPVSSVTLDSTELIMTKADTKQLTAMILPTNATDKTLTWTTSNGDVATVSNTGVVTAVGDGVATVTATANNGMYHECVVKVISASGPSVVLEDVKASPSTTTQVKANIVKNPGVSAYKFTVMYNSRQLTPIQVNANPAFGGTLNDNLSNPNETIGLVSALKVNVQPATSIVVSNLESHSITNDGLTGITGKDGLVIISDLNLDLTDIRAVKITAKVPEQSKMETFFITEEDAAWMQHKSASVIADSNDFKEYVFDFSQNEAFTGTLTQFRFDPSVDIGVPFELKSIEFLAVPSDVNAVSQFNVLWYATEDTSFNGELFTIDFAVADTAVYGDSSVVSLSYDATDICNTSGEYIALYTKDALVQIKEPLPGDVYEDEDVNVYDLTLLARYITALEDFNVRQKEAGDVNNDFLVDIKDVVKLAQYIVGWNGVELMNESGSGTANIEIGTAAVNEAHEVSIPVYIQNNSGIAGFRFEINYSSDELEILSITPNTALLDDNFRTNLGSENGNGLVVTWYQENNMTDEGVLFTIQARLKDNCKTAEITINECDNNMCDQSTGNVIGSYVPGYVLSERYVVESGFPVEDTFICSLFFDDTFENQTAVVVAAFYDEDGRFLQAKQTPIFITSGKKEICFEQINFYFHSYKLFVFRDLQSLKPLTETK